MSGFVEKVVTLIGVTRTSKIQPSKIRTTESNININFSQNKEISKEMELTILSDIEKMADIPE